MERDWARKSWTLYWLSVYQSRQPFPSGERVTFTGKEVLCQKCVQIPVMTATPSPPMKPSRSSPAPQTNSPASNGANNSQSSTATPRKFLYISPFFPHISWVGQVLNVFWLNPFAECTGCRKEIVEGQALIALDSQWHVWCFKCVTCNALLHGEYMGK